MVSVVMLLQESFGEAITKLYTKGQQKDDLPNGAFKRELKKLMISIDYMDYKNY